jgi:hypothetical protein
VASPLRDAEFGPPDNLLGYAITVALRRDRSCHLWVESFERALDDVLEVQAEVARGVAREVQVKLSPHDARRLHPEKRRTIKPPAYEAYLRGAHFWYRRTEEAMRKNLECFQEALQSEPSFASAYDRIADAHTILAC